MFSEHPKSKFWSARNEKNPNEVKLNSHKKFWFDCECGHQFESSLLNINQANNWCPYCSNHAIKLCNNDNCKDCFEKSFASHEKSKYWSKKNEINPRKVFKSSNKKYWFDCYCGHEFECLLNNIINQKSWYILY